MVTIKEYAEKQNKTVQAVYKQLNSKNNKKKLEGHIYKNEVNGKMITFLDEEAEGILSSSSKEAPVIVEKENSNERIEELENQVKLLQAELLESERKRAQAMEEMSKQVLELSNKIVLLEDKQPKRSFWSNLLQK